MSLLKYHGEREQIQVGIDEAGRGCLLGPVFVAAVIWDPTIDDDYTKMIKDSKKISKTKRNELKEYIEQNAIDFNICYADNNEIDSKNILKSTLETMHKTLDGITSKYDKILVDGDKFNKYKNKDHVCIIGGDNKYIAIAAASILAKTHHDYWIECLDDDIKCKYNLTKCMGYGTKKHTEGLKIYGISKYHRKTFCKNILNEDKLQ